MKFTGVIIEESLADKSVFSKLEIVETKVEKVIEKHQTPWLKQWTLHTVSIDADKADEVAEELSKSFDYSHGSAWYADYKNNKYHFIIYAGKVFKVDLSNPMLYKNAKTYGISIGIPEYQVDFAPEGKVWER